jgi:hypothetical protein
MKKNLKTALFVTSPVYEAYIKAISGRWQIRFIVLGREGFKMVLVYKNCQLTEGITLFN